MLSLRIKRRHFGSCRVRRGEGSFNPGIVVGVTGVGRRIFRTHSNHAGLFADFHSCRHHFITNLERAGVRPKIAQTLARHIDIRLTLNVYTHAELADQTAAIGELPGPPG